VTFEERVKEHARVAEEQGVSVPFLALLGGIIKAAEELEARVVALEAEVAKGKTET